MDKASEQLVRKMMVDSTKRVLSEANEYSIRYAGSGEAVPFETEITIKVTGTIRSKKYINPTTKEALTAADYEIDYEDEAIRASVDAHMLAVVAKVTGDDIPLDQHLGSHRLIGFGKDVKNKAMLDAEEAARRAGL